jgi:glycosyltransferase involved in cell wall biosynthesis
MIGNVGNPKVVEIEKRDSRTIAVSVCMATYNGVNYLREQLDSILDQLLADDELVIVDDCSTDSTVALLTTVYDQRIRFYQNKINLGVNASFEKAILMSKKPIVLLADQDDIWRAGRVDILCQTLAKSGALVVSSNTSYVDAKGEPINFAAPRLSASDSKRHLKNIIKIFVGNAGYFGCAMGFRREVSSLILPIPRFVESHDLWIALASNLIKSNVHCESETLARRVHGRNASIIRRGLLPKLKARIIFARSILLLQARRWAGFCVTSSGDTV